MSKNLIILVLFLIIILIGIWYFLAFGNQPDENNVPLDLSGVNDDQIINLLKTNDDALSYINKYKDFRIEKKIPLTQESILEGQEGESFKEVYQDLDLEDNRYLRADLMNAAGNWGLISILDFKTKSVVKAFGLMLLSAGVETQ